MTPLTQTADVAIPELAGLQRRLLMAGAVGAAARHQGIAALMHEYEYASVDEILAQLKTLGNDSRRARVRR